MTAMNFASNNKSFNCSTAAGCSSARIIDRMDTAIIMVVSIIVRLVVSIRLRIC